MPDQFYSTPQVYRYRMEDTLSVVLVGGLFFAAGGLLFVRTTVQVAVSWLLTGALSSPGLRPHEIVLGWIFSALFACLGLILANIYNPIVISDEYIATSFCFFEFRIPWQAVLELKPAEFPGNRRTIGGVLVVVSRSHLPWFYPNYSSLAGGWIGRGIPIPSNIEDYALLIADVKRNVRRTGEGGSQELF